jgi:hypothetical protein
MSKQLSFLVTTIFIITSFAAADGGNPIIDRAVVDTADNLSLVDTNNPFAAAEIVNAWEVWAEGPYPVRLVIFRGDPAEEYGWTKVGESDLETPVVGFNQFTLSTPIAVQAGDFVGFHSPENGVVSLDCGGGSIARGIWYAWDWNVTWPYSSGDFDGRLLDVGSRTYSIRAFQIPVDVTIDIKPGSDTNPINLKSKGKVPVAILSVDGFDATDVDPDTVILAGASAVKSAAKDVNGDGAPDLVLHFNTQDLNLDNASTEAELTGSTTAGLSIVGSDTVTVPKGGKK